MNDRTTDGYAEPRMFFCFENHGYFNNTGSLPCHPWPGIAIRGPFPSHNHPWPGMCCSTGVCGPSVDPALVQLSADLEWLKKQGITVTRHNLSQQPADFAANTAVRDTLQRVGTDALPLLFADGELIASRFYPDRKQLAKVFGLKPETEGNSCCEGSGCCS